MQGVLNVAKWAMVVVGIVFTAIIAALIVTAIFMPAEEGTISDKAAASDTQEASQSGSSAGDSAAGASADSVAPDSPSAQPEDETIQAVIRVTGSEAFTGDIMTNAGSKTVQGVGPAEYPVELSTDWVEMDSVYADFYKDDMDSGTLGLQIVVDGEVVKQTSTSAEMGYVSLDWYPEDS